MPTGILSGVNSVSFRSPNGSEIIQSGLLAQAKCIRVLASLPSEGGFFGLLRIPPSGGGGADREISTQSIPSLPLSLPSGLSALIIWWRTSFSIFSGLYIFFSSVASFSIDILSRLIKAPGTPWPVQSPAQIRKEAPPPPEGGILCNSVNTLFVTSSGLLITSLFVNRITRNPRLFRYWV